jgi:hypothetical protein
MKMPVYGKKVESTLRAFCNTTTAACTALRIYPGNLIHTDGPGWTNITADAAART